MAITSITDTLTVDNEIVLTERRVTTQFIIREIQESIRDRYVRVEIELGPFTPDILPDGREDVRGYGRRGIVAWENAAYDLIRDTWRNEDLIARVTEILNG